MQQLDEDLVDVPQKHSKLDAYFKLNQVDEFARDLYYWQIPEHYTWQAKESIWKRAVKKTRRIGRIYFVPPTQDRFYLRYFKYLYKIKFRLLLQHIKGAKSFDELLLKPDSNDKYANWKEACLGHKLIYDDQEWNDCLEEASRFKSASAMRTLFALILIHGTPTYPMQLWEKFKDDLSDDFVHEGMDKEEAYEKAYAIIAAKVNKMAVQGRNFDWFVEWFNMEKPTMEIQEVDEVLTVERCKVLY